MKVIFWGTPDFAVPSLDKIHQSGHEAAAVVTAPDKPRGRGQELKPTAVKKYAVEHGIKVLQPEDFKSDEFAEELKAYSADIFVIVAFRILPEKIFTIPPHGSFNLHASLLPKYRGAAPIHRALINGEKETGVTTFALKKKVDTGKMYMQKKIDIEPEDNLGTLHDKLAELGAEAVLETLDMIESGDVKLIEQDDSEATKAPKISKETGEIDFSKPAKDIHNLIRALSPYPGAYFMHKGKSFKIYKSEVLEDPGINQGDIIEFDGELIFGTGKYAIKVLELQMEGRKRMPTEEFLRGYSFVR